MGNARALAVAALVAAVSGCGGEKAAGPAGCLRIYFVPSASAAKIAAVRRQLVAHEDKIASLQFVSKKQALAEMRWRHPAIVRDMPYNPLPAAFRVTPRAGKAGEALVHELQPCPRGVHVIRYARRRSHC